ncbi:MULTISPECIES: hypothetical protein [Streptomyces]|uniref:Uncharacterized protein n=1 Tax=Streptomyces yunnanensis TaxID=156453 RepID=A0A9X8MZK9_9ACTN|nr:MULTISPECIES: hypothetical protein [Streptomyces]SHM44135.1 hypothetical protein SAMN05216268_11125 [Streptomyces yunnanensis]
MSGHRPVTYELDESYSLFPVASGKYPSAMDTDDLKIADSDAFGFMNLMGSADPVPDDLPRT